MTPGVYTAAFPPAMRGAGSRLIDLELLELGFDRLGVLRVG